MYISVENMTSHLEVMSKEEYSLLIAHVYHKSEITQDCMFTEY